VVLYGCVNRRLTLRDENKSRVFENGLLRRIFGPKKDEVTGGWRGLHNDELHNLHSWSSIIRMIESMRMRWTGHVAGIGEKRNAYVIGGEARRKEITGKIET
jgi:hypothetical protein